MAQAPTDPAADEKTKIAKFADFMRQGLPEVFRRAAEPRLSLIVSGKANRRGIAYDLNELGIRDDVSMTAVAAR